MSEGSEGAAMRDSGDGENPRERAGGFRLVRLWPVAVLVAGLAAFKLAGLDAYLSFDMLQENRVMLMETVARWGVGAVALYMLVYAAVIAFSLPGGAVMTMAGGFLFGQWLGTAYVVIAATLGATLLFLAAKTSLGDHLSARAGPWLSRMRDGFNENALSYLLFLRLIPAFPFFVVNLVPAFLGVRLSTYVLGTAVGIVPGTFVFASFGAGLGAIFDRGDSFSASAVLTPEIVTALVGLGVIALLPIAYKKLRGRKPGG